MKGPTLSTPKQPKALIVLLAGMKSLAAGSGLRGGETTVWLFHRMGAAFVAVID